VVVVVAGEALLVNTESDPEQADLWRGLNLREKEITPSEICITSLVLDLVNMAYRQRVPA
jgi:hypothetical protein